MENTNIIPFGKYKGQPLEAIQEDKQYLDWLMAQDWFRSRYPQLQQVIINNFCEPSETPEHNEIQGRFLENSFVQRFLKCVLPETLSVYDVDCSKSLLIPKKDIEEDFCYEVKFEVKGIDVIITEIDLFHKGSMWYYTTRLSDSKCLNIEIKPSLSDDYPAVLRQMKANRSTVLFINSYSGRGISYDNFCKLFLNEGIKVVLSTDI